MNLIQRLFRKLSNVDVVNEFHKKYYYSKVWKKTYWMGEYVRKSPFDLWIYQELIFELKPDVIIECGAGQGGSALYFANVLDILGQGEVLSVDYNDSIERCSHPRITRLTGSSVSDEVVSELKRKIDGRTSIMVTLDSDHSKEHVLKELEIYSRIIPVGGYIVVEDGHINNNPIMQHTGPGPLEAIEEFLLRNKNFEIDKEREKFFMTWNPSGYLKRTK
jgi:cephalosporin hydroxylase